MNWKQWAALVRLRFALTKNQVCKAGTLNQIIYTIFFFVVVLFAISSVFLTTLIGAYLIRDASAENIVLIWNIVTLAVLGSTLFELVNRIQKSDVIEIDRLLHLPMSFRGAFLLNYASSLVSFNTLMLAPSIIGLAMAMPLAKGTATMVAIPLALSILFMVTAFSYFARNWLADKMKNKRAKGWMMFVIPFAMVGGLVATNKLIDSDTAQEVLIRTPFGWLSSGIDQANRNGNPVSGIGGTVFMSAIGAACLFFAFRSSIKNTLARISGSRPNRVP